MNGIQEIISNSKSNQKSKRKIPRLCFSTVLQKPRRSVYKVMSLCYTVIFKEKACQHPQKEWCHRGKKITLLWKKSRRKKTLQRLQNLIVANCCPSFQNTTVWDSYHFINIVYSSDNWVALFIRVQGCIFI